MLLSAKYYKAVFAIQTALDQEYSSNDPSVEEKTLEERLQRLEENFKIATEGGSIDFARGMLGKILCTYMKVKKIVS